MKSCFAIVAALAAVATNTQAASTTTPYRFTNQAIPSTGHFEWDEFASGSIFSPAGYTPDVVSTGIGSGAVITNDFTAQPFDGPPVPLQTSTLNVYAGGTLVDYDVDLSGLDTTEASTTVVLQVSIIGALTPSSILLDGIAPTTLVDRGIKEDVVHGPNASEFDTRFYWAEWQVAADSDYLIEFSNVATHQSLSQVRAEYFNTATPFAAVAATAVPEPSSVGIAAVVACGVAVFGRRRRFNAKASRS